MLSERVSDLAADVTALECEHSILKQAHKEVLEENARLYSTLTREQAEGTRLVLENRELRAKVDSLSPVRQSWFSEAPASHNEKYDSNGQPW